MREIWILVMILPMLLAIAAQWISFERRVYKKLDRVIELLEELHKT